MDPKHNLARLDAPGPATDLELARRVASGDHDALRLMMRRHNQTLFRTARSILRDDHEAEDVVQEGYLLAYRSIGDFRGGAKCGVPGCRRQVAKERPSPRSCVTLVTQGTCRQGKRGSGTNARELRA